MTAEEIAAKYLRLLHFHYTGVFSGVGQDSNTNLIRANGLITKELRRGGIATVVAEREVRVGERWYVSCFQRG